ncbi:MAG TPA: hypothetical protein ENK57_17635, partial [Polyangiaceae bacterium]|nr:hypothetical protein [Polyangiaceae bacterium]
MSRDLHSGRKLLLSTCTIGTIALATACGVEQAPEEPVAGRHELPNWQNAAQSGEYHCGKFYLVHMDPAPESKTATPLSTITLKFSRAVDPSTTGGVVLRERESKRIVPANVTSNGVFVHITPLRPLNHNYRYTVDVDQIEAQSPHTDPLDVTKRFFTAPNFPDLYIRYKNGLAVREHDFMWTPSTGELRVDHFVPGPDGILQTTDDVQDTWVLSQYDTEQDNVYTIVRGEPGPDGIYETADDAVVYERTLSFDARGETSRSHLYFGPDMQMGTGDDYTTPLQSRYYDNDDVYLGRCDGNICTQYVYYAGETHVLTYDDPGPDGVWR